MTVSNDCGKPVEGGGKGVGGQRDWTAECTKYMDRIDVEQQFEEPVGRVPRVGEACSVAYRPLKVLFSGGIGGGRI